MPDLGLDVGQNLNAGRAITDQTDVLALELDLIIPVGSVEERSLVLLDTRNRRPPPVIKNTGSVDENIAVIDNLFVVEGIPDGNIVTTLLVIPVRTGHRMVCLDVLIELVLLREAIEVIEDFTAAGIHARPIELGLKRPGVVVGWNVTGASESTNLAFHSQL